MTVVITGGNKGIGEGITKEFQKAGYHVVIGARTSLQKEAETSDYIRFVQTDVRQENDVKQLLAFALDWTGRVDVMINNAGYSKWFPIHKITEDVFDDMAATNLKGVFWGCKHAANVMKTGGVIINVSSIAGKRGSANNSLYCATKFGVNGLTQSLAKELGEKGIRVNAVCPVLVKTEGLMKALSKKDTPASTDASVDEFIQSFTESQSALKRLPLASEVGNLCVFLASDLAAAITGQCINIDCGVLPQ